jgi:hypothetical protein
MSMMLSVKDWILIAGFAVGCLGYGCLPTGQSASPPNNLSFFVQSADGGAFKSLGFLVLVAGILLVVVGLIIPRKP